MNFEEMYEKKLNYVLAPLRQDVLDQVTSGTDYLPSHIRLKQLHVDAADRVESRVACAG